MLQDFNYHTHTYRCGHAIGSDEDYVLAAIKAGYKTLGFSDHAPYRHHPNPRIHMNWDQIDDYLDSIRALKDKYQDQITILTGFESEFYPETIDEKLELQKRSDYLILGQHFAYPDGRGTYFKYNTDEEIITYAKGVCAGLESGLFTYLCHPDVYMFRQNEFTAACAEAAHMICQKAAETNTPVEINVHRINRGKIDFGQDGFQYSYPHRNFWKIASQYPLKCLIGIDAHDPEELLDLAAVEAAFAELSDLNLDYITEPFILR